MAKPKPVLCSRCEYEIGHPKPLENVRGTVGPSPSTLNRFNGQYDHRPTRGRVFDRLGTQNPNASAGRRSNATLRPLRTFKPPVVQDDRWYHIQHGGNVQPLTKTQLRRMRDEVQQARERIPQVEGSQCQRKLGVTQEPLPAPFVPATKSSSIRAPKTWRPRKDEDLRRKGIVSAEPKPTALGKTNEGIIDVYRGRDPPFSANDLSFLKDFHKDHSAIDLYDLTPENREIVELALKNTKEEGLLITRGSGHQLDRKLEDEAPFGRDDLEYLRQYFSVTPIDTLFGLTTEEGARVSRLDDYLMARDALAEVRRTLEREAESSIPPGTEAAAHKAPRTERPMVEGRGDLFFEHEPEDDFLLGTSDEEYEGIIGTRSREFSPRVAPGPIGKLDDDVAKEQLGQRPKTKEELLAVAFNEVMPRDEPNKYRHLKPLYISAHVECVPISKVFIDCGATVNILHCSLMKKLAKTREDLIPSDVVMSSFVDDKSKTIGVLPLKITVADQTRISAFYVVESSVDYNILLGRDWIHQAGCIPSSLFQLLFFWDGQRVSIHPDDERPFETNAVQARIYDDDVGWVVLTGNDASGRPTRTTAQKVLELGAENARQDSAREVLIYLTTL
ncbi:unnamed protein product [Prunus brigantina]